MLVSAMAATPSPACPKSLKGSQKLDLLVVADPHPTTWASLAVKPGARTTRICCRSPRSSRCKGSRTASNRAIQWGEQIVKPIFESKDDLEVMYLLAKKLGFADQMFKNIKVENNLPVAEDILREINRGSWSTGYCGQSPERLKAHMANQAEFDMLTPARDQDGPRSRATITACRGRAGARRRSGIPGTPLLYNTNLAVMDGGGTFRARFGVEREEKLPDGTTLQGQPAGRRLLLQGLRDQGRLSGVHARRAEEARLGQGSDRGRTGGDQQGQSGQPRRGVLVDRPVGRHPARRDEARLHPLRQRQGARECLRICRTRSRCTASRSTRRASIWSRSIRRCPTPSSSGVPNIGFTVQKAAVDKGIAKQFPLILSSGRLVEYEGGGEETRSNKWLAELQQDMFIEINPADAAERGIKDGGWVWVTGAENSSKAKVKALVTERVGKGVAWMPFHFGGWFEGEDQRGNYPAGHRPDRARRKRQHDHHLRLRPGRPACRNPKSRSVRSERHKEQRPWHE